MDKKKLKIQELVKGLAYGCDPSKKTCLILFKELAQYLDDPAIPPNVIGIVIQSLASLLGYHQSTVVRNAVLSVVQIGFHVHPQKALFVVLDELHKIGAYQLENSSISRAESGRALLALSWTCRVIELCMSMDIPLKISADDVKWQSLLGTQASLFYGACAAEKVALERSALRKLKQIWKKIGEDCVNIYMDTFSKSSTTFAAVGILGALASYDPQKFSPRKVEYIQFYVKLVIMAKKKPQFKLLDMCKSAMRFVDHDNLESILLPAIQKALLRNPENVLPAIAELFRGVSVDLSKHAVNITRYLTPQLLSKDDMCRSQTVNALIILGTQMSDAVAVKAVINQLSGILKGTEGKLALPGQKMDVINILGGLSQCAVSSGETRNELTCYVIDVFATVLRDNHEPSVIFALQCLSKWCKKWRTSVPENLLKILKDGLSAKAVSSAARTAYIECMLEIFTKDNLEQAGPMSSSLFTSIEKTKSQASRAQFVYEALCAAHFIVRLTGSEYSLDDTKVKSFQNIILDGGLGLFTSPKFLQQCEQSGLIRFALYCESLFMEYSDKLDYEALSRHCSALLYPLLHQNYEVRKTAETTVRRLRDDAPVDVSDAILSKFHDVMKNAELPDEGSLDEAEDTSKKTPPKRFTGVLSCLLDIPHLDSDKDKASSLAMKVLLDCHHPCIVATRGDLWTDFLFNVGIDASEFIEHHIDEIIKLCISKYDEDQISVRNTLSNLSRIAPRTMIRKVLEHVQPILQDPSLLSISKADFGIMMTPEGQLFNRSIIDSGPRIVENKNVKRENKAYSYKEQMEFLELQKEMEAKNTKKTKTNASKVDLNYGFSQNLTKKQVELIKNELEKESAIRKSLLEMNSKVQLSFYILSSSIDQPNCSALQPYICDLIDLTLPLLASQIASQLAQDLFVTLSKIVSCDALSSFILQLVYATLRLHYPVHDVPKDWAVEILSDCAARITYKLLDKSNIEGNKTAIHGVPFSSSCFCYMYPFLGKILNGGSSGVTVDDKVILAALQIVKVHADRAIKDDGAKVLPRRKMLDSMRILIGQSTSAIQALACEAFISTCQAMSAAFEEHTQIGPEITVIAECLLSPADILRKTALQGLKHLAVILPSGSSDEAICKLLVRRLWVAGYDTNEDCQLVANQLWVMLLFNTSDSLCTDLLTDIVHHEPKIQEASAAALHSALEENIKSIPTILTSLIRLYEDLSQRPPPVLDNLGRVVSDAIPDNFQSRIGIAKALQKISPDLSSDMIGQLFSFFVPGALKDLNTEVHLSMLDAALQAVNDHGKECTSVLMAVFEDFLKQAPDSENFDAVRQSVVILIGTLARHLDKGDSRVKPIFAKLTEALSTPSQQVQEAVAKCLPPLVPAIKADAPEIVKKLLVILLESENYGERKGAAYGLAGMIKGLGIIAFKQLDVMNTLTEAIQDKKNYRHREGALLAFEMFCTMLGRLFEPYIVHVLPYLLLCFGDGNQYVREAADDTARAVMRNLTAHGVKLVLPSLLSALEEDSWRTKTGSVELLGAMAYCAPKQLSACLPSVVPHLCNVLTDSHPKVQKAGHQALKQIGSVIRNPEISSITPILLGALSEPFRKTSKCLQTLLDTKFVHFIDAPSLALIMPVVNRAFEDRSTDTRRMAAQIIGNMYSLTEQKDLKPYLPSVVPGLKNSLLDPVPDVRTVAAKALGAMVKGSGEQLFEELLPWLMDTLTSERSSVDRSGAAQGIAEVLAALGVSRLERLMPDIVRMATSSEVLPHVRDGYIMLYIYLPTTFENNFTPFIGDIIPALLQSLADECEFLRDTALLAGQCIISKYAQEAVSLLLPQLEEGMFDDNWRIRLSSIQLLGELLYQVSGVTGKMSTHGDDDDNFGTMEGQKAIRAVLGEKRCHRVFSGLYIGRSDVMLQVRQSALHIWKIVVPNTPRVLREILPTLFEILLRCSASSSYDKRQVAAKTMGDIVKKLGERMLPEIIPILENESNSEDDDQRQGVCIGLAEIIKSCTKDAVLAYASELIPTIKRGLCDRNQDVRTAAATTFENLHSAIGSQALEEIIPDMLEQLDDSDSSEHIIDGLRQVIAVKGKAVMPFIVPKLIQPPVNTQVLAVLSSVAGEALTKHLPKILKALLSGLIDASTDEEKYADTLNNCKDVILSVEGEHGNRIIMDDLIKSSKSDDGKERRSATALLTAFCQGTEFDYGSYVAMFMQVFFKLLADSEVLVQQEAWLALSAIVKHLDAAEQLQHVGSVRQAIRYASEEIRQCGGLLPGFCQPKKGMAPVLPILREGILNGSPDTKEQSAKALSECIGLLTSEALKPSVITITGPLIRILGDRFSANVRIAVLETLTLLLDKAGQFLKPFLPQLQTTFSKALHDSNRPVRLQAAKGLRNLSVIHTRLDPLFTDFNNSIKAERDVSVKETMLHALRGCIDVAGTKMGLKIKSEVLVALTSLVGAEEETCSITAAGCLGSFCSSFDDDELDKFLQKNVFDIDLTWSLRMGRSTILAVALKESASKAYTEERAKKFLSVMMQYASLERVEIVNNSIRSAAYLMMHCVKASQTVPTDVRNIYEKGFQHSSNDVKILVCDSISWVANSMRDANSTEQAGYCLPNDLLVFFIGRLLSLTKEKNVTVRSSSDLALVALLLLHALDQDLQKITSLLVPHDAASLSELMKTRLKKSMSSKMQTDDIDNTLLKQ